MENKKNSFNNLNKFSLFIFNCFSKSKVKFSELKSYESIYKKIYFGFNNLLENNSNNKFYVKNIKDIQKYFLSIFCEFNHNISHEVIKEENPYSYFSKRNYVDIYTIFPKEENYENTNNTITNNQSNNININQDNSINEEESIELENDLLKSGGMII